MVESDQPSQAREGTTLEFGRRADNQAVHCPKKGLIAITANKSAAARALGISRASLYYQPVLPDKDWQLKQQIEAVLEKHKDYGYRRVARELALNKKLVQRVMQKFGIKAYRRRGRKWRKKPTAVQIQYPEPSRVQVSRMVV